MPTASWQISWRSGRTAAVLPIVVHSVAASASIGVALAQRWAWLWFGIVLASAINEGRIFRREFGRSRSLTLCGSLITIDGVAARAERGWLGPGWTVIWLRLSNGRRQVVSVLRSELRPADHAVLRRHLREIDFR